MKTIYTVHEARKAEKIELLSTENEARARKYFKEKAVDITPVDVSEWNDSDQGWNNVARFELQVFMFDDDEDYEPVDWQILEESEWFEI